jgi:hypothetical protein
MNATDKLKQLESEAPPLPPVYERISGRLRKDHPELEPGSPKYEREMRWLMSFYIGGFYLPRVGEAAAGELLEKIQKGEIVDLEIDTVNAKTRLITKEEV